MATDGNSFFFFFSSNIYLKSQSKWYSQEESQGHCRHGTHFPPHNVDKENITGTKLKEVLQWKFSTFFERAFSFFSHTYRGYSHQIQLNYFIVIVHLVHSIPHQSGNKLILIPDQKTKKRIIPCVSGRQQQREEKVRYVLKQQCS